MLIHVTKWIRSDVIDSLCSEKNLRAAGHSWLKSNDPALPESWIQREILLYFTQAIENQDDHLICSSVHPKLGGAWNTHKEDRTKHRFRKCGGHSSWGHFNNFCEILFSLKILLRKAQGTLLHNIKLTNWTQRGIFQLISSLDPACIKRFQQKEDQSVKTAYPTTNSQW